MRCDIGLEWPERLRERLDNSYRIACSAEFLNRPIMMLESWRRSLYNEIPAENDWFKRAFDEWKNICKKLLPKLDKELKKSKPRREEAFKKILRYEAVLIG